MGMTRFEWDSAKAEANRRKHGVSFEEARSLFTSGTDYLEIHDERHGEDEDRYVAVGPVARGILCVAFVERGEDTLRIISARRATRREADLIRRKMEGDRS